MTTNDDALDAARFRYIRDMLLCSVETNKDFRVTVRCREIKVLLPPNSLRGLKRPADALTIALDELMRIVPTPEPEGRGTVLPITSLKIPMPPCVPNRAPDRADSIGNLRAALEPFAEVYAWAIRNNHNPAELDINVRGPCPYSNGPDGKPATMWLGHLGVTMCDHFKAAHDAINSAEPDASTPNTPAQACPMTNEIYSGTWPRS